MERWITKNCKMDFAARVDFVCIAYAAQACFDNMPKKLGSRLCSVYVGKLSTWQVAGYGGDLCRE